MAAITLECVSPKENPMRYHDIVMAVRELLERHWDVYQIASRLKLDPVLIKQIIDSLT